MHLLAWFDDTPKRPLAEKIAAARAAFAERYGCAATLVLIPDGAAPARGPHVRPGMLFVGRAQ